MLTHTDLKKGVQFIYEDQPWEVLEASAIKMAQRRPVIQSKIRNLLDGRVQEKNFQQGDVFQEAELEKKDIKFIYQSKGGSRASASLPPTGGSRASASLPPTGGSRASASLPPKGQYYFCEINNPSKRFSFTEAQVGAQAKYLRPNEIVTGIVFDEKIINFVLPIKVQLKVKESTPGVKGDRAQGGTKSAILESGAEIQVPLFVEEGDTIEVNTETGEYVRRV